MYLYIFIYLIIYVYVYTYIYIYIYIYIYSLHSRSRAAARLWPEEGLTRIYIYITLTEQSSCATIARRSVASVSTKRDSTSRHVSKSAALAASMEAAVERPSEREVK